MAPADPSALSELSWALAAVPALLAGAVGAFARLGARAMQPRTATWTVAAFAVLTSLCSTYALATMAAVAVGRLDDVADIGRWAPSALAGPSTAPLVVAAPAAVAIAAAVSSALTMLARTGVMLVRVERQLRQPAAQRVAVVSTSDADAYALGGITSGQIVVTTGMLAELSALEFGVLVEHENAHLRLRHHLFKAAVRAASCLNPLLRPAVTAVDESTERWSDECAVESVGDRRLVAQALARAALATQSGVSARRAASRFGTSAVMMRVDALLNPRLSRRGNLVLAAAAVVVCVSLGSTAVASVHTERVFEKAQHAYAATQ
jgi:beta-lactamase regulating signal transducer with metallopeptidase domain